MIIVSITVFILLIQFNRGNYKEVILFGTLNGFSCIENVFAHNFKVILVN